MKVRELIEILEELDPEASVYIMSQQNWPFEVAIHGVTVREEFTETDDEDDAAEDTPARTEGDRWSARPEALPRNDVFIVEGSQLRYGSKDAWDAAYRGGPARAHWPGRDLRRGGGGLALSCLSSV